jgi:hypothetical protein
MTALRTLILLPLLAIALAIGGARGEALAAQPTAGVALPRGVPAVRPLKADPVLAFLPGSPPELTAVLEAKQGRHSPPQKFSRAGLVRRRGGPLIASRASRARAMVRVYDDLAPTLAAAKTGHLIAPSAVPPPLYARRHVTGNASLRRVF